MAEPQQLLRIRLEGQLAIEIQGPPPPARVHDTVPTLSRFSLTTPLAGLIGVEVAGAPHEYPGLFAVKPFLFEETAYYFTVEVLNEGLASDGLALLSPGRVLPAQLRRVGRSSVYAASLNFGSEVGHVDLQVCRNGRTLLDVGLEVFPSKIDYRKDMAALRHDLEKEVRDLAFAVGKTTYQRAKRRREVKAGESEWLENLRQLFDELQKAFNRVKQAPLSKIHTDRRVQRADRPTRHSPHVRRYVQSHMHLCQKKEHGQFQAHGESWALPKLPIERKVLSYDTTENRYVKWALHMLLRRVRASLSKLTALPTGDGKRFAEWASLLERTEQRLRNSAESAFLEGIDHRRLAPVQSLALHMAPGYREFFATCLDLVAGLRISGGPFQLSEKEMHLLYEMWCFIKLGSILRHKCGKAEKPDWLKVDRSGVYVTLKKGVRSELRLTSGKGESLLVAYNPEERAPTGNCYPDTMLSIDKKGSDLGFHFVFDAKYRISDDPDYVKRHGAPGPPEDTINKMHAYRDRIVHSQERPSNRATAGATVWDMGERKFSQKTVAAFVLYPNALASAADNRFFRSVQEFGIGGLPFLPEKTDFVAELLSHLLDTSSESEEDSAIAIRTSEERERTEKAHRYGMIVIVSSKEQMDYLLQARIYHMPYRAIRGIRLRADFLLFLQTRAQFGKDAGVNYSASVRNFEVGNRSDITPTPPWPQRREDPYVWFRLKTVERLSHPLPPDPSGRQMLFRLTTQLALEQAQTIDELSLVREPEQRLYSELKRAGFSVTVREHNLSKVPTYDIADLRLDFTVRSEGRGEIALRFDPATSAFYTGSHELFDFDQLMFNADRCVDAVRTAAAHVKQTS